MKTLYIEINYANLTVKVNLNGDTGSTAFGSKESLDAWVESRKIKYNVELTYKPGIFAGSIFSA